MFGDGIFTQEGEAWRHSRDLIRPQLTYRQYEDLKIFEPGVESLLEVIQHESESGTVELQELFFRLTLDVTTAFLFGESIESLKAPDSVGENTFAGAFNTAQSWVMRRYRLMDLYWLLNGKQFRDACRDVHRFADQIIDRNLARERTKENQNRYVFLDAMAKSTQDRDALRGQIINLLTAGRDTTACLLSWTFFLLVRHERVLKKLKDEIARHTGTDLTRKDLHGMTYLQNVLKETLRLYPSVPVNTRTATKTVVLPTGGGLDGQSPVLIPKGSAIAYSVYSMHRRPDLYGMDAELFRPERWDEQMPLYNDATNKKWGYLPFNNGPRICIGSRCSESPDRASANSCALLQWILRLPKLRTPCSASYNDFRPSDCLKGRRLS
jgi:cytochrome P450